MEVEPILRSTDTEAVKRRLAFQKSFSQEVTGSSIEMLYLCAASCFVPSLLLSHHKMQRAKTDIDSRIVVTF